MKKKWLYLSDGDRAIAVSLARGDKININHSGCPAGEDRKKRLHIERVENGNVLCYCHHCSESCVIRDSVPKNKRFKKHYLPNANGYGTTERTLPLSLPRDGEANVANWPPQARVWLGKYGITNGEIARYGLLYSERMGRVLLPCWEEGTLSSFQARKIFPEDTGPKYLSYGEKNSVYVILQPTPIIKALVIVEDVVSAIKVGRYADVLALRKASMSDRALQWIVKQGYKEFILFLDDDNAQVKKAQIVIKNKLEAFGTVRIIHAAGYDPKEHSDAELIEVLNEQST